MEIRVQLVCLAACLLAGCGKTDVVTVDPSQSQTSDRGAHSPSQPADSGMSRRSAGGDRESAATPETGSQAAAPAAMDPARPGGPAVAAVPAVPGGPPAANDPAAAGAQQPTPSEVDPPPEPSDYYVELQSGRTLNIQRLLEEAVAEFEEKLDSIADGEHVLHRNYSDNAVSLADQLAGGPAAGPAGMPPTAANDPARGVGIAPPGGVPGRPALPRSAPRGRPTGQRAAPAYGPAAGGPATGAPFMTIGHLSGTLRGPTAAYRRDGTAIVYASYNRDARRDDTLITWDAEGRPVLLDQYVNGRRDGLRVLFRTRSENDPTGYVALVQEWTRGERTATHLVAEDGMAKTVDPAVPLEMPLEKQLGSRLTEIRDFNSKLRECEDDLRKAVSGQDRRGVRTGTRTRRASRARQKARSARELRDAFANLQAGMESLGNWRREYQRRRDIARGR